MQSPQEETSINKQGNSNISHQFLPRINEYTLKQAYFIMAMSAVDREG